MFRSRRAAFAALVVSIVAVSLFLVAFSPLALRQIASLSGINWTRLSNVGQTYGAISAVLAALALIGVAGSVLLQAREARHNRWAASRNRHAELISFALKDPFYIQVFAPPFPGCSVETGKLMAYINLLLQYWSMMWEFGDLPERQLRANLANVLQTEAGRLYWSKIRKQTPFYSTRREHEFHEIANEIYTEQIASAPYRSEESQSNVTRLPESRVLQLARAGVALALLSASGVMVKRLLERRHKS